MNAASLFLPTPLSIGLLMAPPNALAPVVLLKLRLMYLAEMIWRLCRLGYSNGLSVALRAVLTGCKPT